MTVFLTLSGILFDDFEVPDTINFGGEQALVVHKLPGGDRVIDAMGRDDKDIGWSGRFRGSEAEFRARSLDYLRIQGQPLELTWSTFRFQVLIRSFEAQYQQPFEIPYSISCTVLNDEFATLAGLFVGLVEALGVDMSNILTLGGNLNLPAITTSVATVSTAVTALQNSPTLSADSLTTAAAASLTSAQAATQTAIATANTALNTTGSVAGIVPGGAPSTMASNLAGHAAAFGQLNQLYQLSSSILRMTTNLANRNS